MLDGFADDIRYAVRGLRRDPLLAVAATATLAVAIGANTTIFSIADSILIRPLPYPGADRIQWISERTGPLHEDIGAAPDYYRLRDENRIFESVAAFVPFTANWTGVEQPEQLDGAMVSASFFRVMGMQPLLGRYLAAEEEGPKAPPVVVLSYTFWRSRLGSDPAIVGKKIALDRLPRTIIGVMPQGFTAPEGAQVWAPLTVDETSQRVITPRSMIMIVSMVARLKPGVSKQQIETEMNRLGFVVRAAYPKVFESRGFRTDLVLGASPLQEYITGPLRPALLVLTGAVGLVLLIACVNLANLLLARAGSRQRELAVRLALGSNRSRIARQILTESLVLALPGGLGGIGLAGIAVEILNNTKPAVLVRYPAISLDWGVLGFTLTLTVATSLVFGMAPAISAAAIHIQEALKAASLTHSGGRGAARLRKALMVAELGISLVLLIGAGLLARSFLHLAHTELGFRTDHLLTFRVTPIGPFDRDYRRFYAQVLERLQQIPGVRSAALTNSMPLGGGFGASTGRISVVGRPPVPFLERPLASVTMVSDDFFRTLGIPLKNGRLFERSDFALAAPTGNQGLAPTEPVVVNEAFVRRIFPGADPLGHQLGDHLLFGPDDRKVDWTIVGVVSNVRGAALGAEPDPMIFRCNCTGGPVFGAGFLVATAGDPKGTIRAVEQQVRSVDPDQPIFDVKTMEERRDAGLAPERFQLILIGTFAAIAIILTAVGVYGILSYLIARRTREIGIRMALGAQPGDVLRLVTRETAWPVLLAIGMGLGSAWALTRYIRSLLYGITELDAPTFVWAAIFLSIVVVITSALPFRRAVRVDPQSALREE